jgi:TrmH family RNA methyltransferase
MKLRIVLVEPREAGNVGAAARVMKNFGFDELWIVGEHPELLPVAIWWGSGADDVLAAARFVPTLQQALGDARITVATTAMRGRTSIADLDPSSTARLFAELGDDDTMAIVFGREDSGLTRDEVVLCQRAASIPTNPAFPTMNLAQSVGVFCYELSTMERRASERVRPPAALTERLHERAEALLLEVGFLQESNPSRIYEELRAIAGRADLDERETTVLLGILRQVEWALRHEV